MKTLSQYIRVCCIIFRSERYSWLSRKWDYRFPWGRKVLAKSALSHNPKRLAFFRKHFAHQKKTMDSSVSGALQNTTIYKSRKCWLIAVSVNGWIENWQWILTFLEMALSGAKRNAKRTLSGLYEPSLFLMRDDFTRRKLARSVFLASKRFLPSVVCATSVGYQWKSGF
jgi:hypothetical protein